MAKAKSIDRREWVLAALEEYEQRLTRFAQRLVGGDINTARDVVQHAFLRLCDQQPEALADHVGAWLFSVCHHRAMDLRRKAGRVEALPADALVPGRENDPADDIETRDAGELLRRVIETLPENQRLVVGLWSEGFSHREISQALSQTEGHVRVLAHRAWKEIRAHPLTRQLLDTSEFTTISTSERRRT